MSEQPEPEVFENPDIALVIAKVGEASTVYAGGHLIGSNNAYMPHLELDRKALLHELQTEVKIGTSVYEGISELTVYKWAGVDNPAAYEWEAEAQNLLFIKFGEV